jgi:NAD(P)-dependent dehydrogenase (short-subunit alcohol dehydrogenase family)
MNTIRDNTFSLEGKTILITGASSGIGRACSIACSRAGARIILCGRNEARLKETLDNLHGIDLQHRIIVMELTNTAQVDDVMNNILREYAKIDGMIYCAGISTTLPLRNFTPEKMHQMFDCNVTSAFYLARWISQKKLIPEDGQSYIFMSSVMGNLGDLGKSMYSATKGALQAGCRSLAVELASKKIRVNTISPGVVETPMSENAVYSRNSETRKVIENLHPLGLGKPDYVSDVAVFLMSPAAKWITGINLIVDGGYSAK